eukprot:GDKH01008876.1.p1 GENE.GDKH01008876.1~~GDKH01008876.1.p1  ORF type:complete len:66 (+),score=3.36 GDKH01008876.1:130-327(+)
MKMDAIEQKLSAYCIQICTYEEAPMATNADNSSNQTAQTIRSRILIHIQSGRRIDAPELSVLPIN